MFMEVFAKHTWQSSRESSRAQFSIEKMTPYFIWKMAAPGLYYSTFASKEVWGGNAGIYPVN